METNGDSIYRKPAGNKKIQGPPRLWMDKVQLAGMVVQRPRVYYPRGTPGKLGSTRIQFRLMTISGEDRQCYITCWAAGWVADWAAEAVQKGDQLFVYGSLETFFYQPKKGEKAPTPEGVPGYTYIYVRHLFQIPWREDSYFRHGTVPVPTERYHEMLHELDEKRRPFQTHPTELDEFMRQATPFSPKEMEEAKAAAVRARQRYACVLPPHSLHSNHAERDRVQDRPGEGGGPPEAGEVEEALGEEGAEGGPLPRDHQQGDGLPGGAG